MLNTARQRGMGLIEVMIALTLAAILMALAAPSFTTGMQNRQIRAAAEAIQSGVVYARTEALRRNRVVEFELRDASGWRVGCDTVDATTDANGEQLCPDVLQTREAQEGSANAAVAPVQTANTPNGTVASTPVFTGVVKFTPLGRTTGDSLPAGSVATFRITNPNGGACVADGGPMRCLWVAVTAAGQVRMCDPAVAAGDPRAC